MSLKPVSSILFACVLFALPAYAQTGDAPKDASKATAISADVLTPEQAKRALDTLQDDQMRARIWSSWRVSSARFACSGVSTSALIAVALDASLGASPVWAYAGSANKTQANRIEETGLSDTRPSFYYVHDSKTGIAIGLRACMMSDRPFSPPPCVESLPLRGRSLGICRIKKMPKRLIAGNRIFKRPSSLGGG